MDAKDSLPCLQSHPRTWLSCSHQQPAQGCNPSAVEEWGVHVCQPLTAVPSTGLWG